jgi:ubiquitin-protein ligase E3 A
MEDKKKFLAFATGSDRAPIGGLKAMRFSITRHGEDGDR